MPLFSLDKEFRFEASHQLMYHDGACARLHGHSWVGHVVVQGSVLHEQGPKKGMLMDFSDLSVALKPIVARLDHYHLNDVLDTDSPTSEVVAQWVAQQLQEASFLRSYNGSVWLKVVRIEETCTSAADYYP